MKFTSSEAGNYFYQVVDHGAAVPTVDTSKSGTSAVKGENTITLSNLTEDARDIYIVVKNASGGESAALVRAAEVRYILRQKRVTGAVIALYRRAGGDADGLGLF